MIARPGDRVRDARSDDGPVYQLAGDPDDLGYVHVTYERGGVTLNSLVKIDDAFEPVPAFPVGWQPIYTDRAGVLADTIQTAATTATKATLLGVKEHRADGSTVLWTRDTAGTWTPTP